ncbi:hypothetical protein FK531_01255 [Rhodococcus spelaei]|uniref:Uncharacterized protein n=1 Tax=Rhodococcus spelaei TaxID=2546320 RepID=A0A541BR04_9NOCA|nr:hypothetical protein [Rhodococcus spelaei]TQF74751.1 hypothetical protein FK531_01255 [Rhodococcus spelaei]
MSRTLARRGASVLAAAAMLGGGLALGGGTASAAEAPGLGSVGDAIGSVDPGPSALSVGCEAVVDAPCSFPTPYQVLYNLIVRGNGSL